jgi:hypothetical protein
MNWRKIIVSVAEPFKDISGCTSSGSNQALKTTRIREAVINLTTSPCRFLFQITDITITAIF